MALFQQISHRLDNCVLAEGRHQLRLPGCAEKKSLTMGSSTAFRARKNKTTKTQSHKQLDKHAKARKHSKQTKNKRTHKRTHQETKANKEINKDIHTKHNAMTKQIQARTIRLTIPINLEMPKTLTVAKTTTTTITTTHHTCKNQSMVFQIPRTCGKEKKWHSEQWEERRKLAQRDSDLEPTLQVNTRKTDATRRRTRNSSRRIR